MESRFRGIFLKDISKIKDKKVQESIKEVIKNIEDADSIKEIKNLKKMKNCQDAFRIRINDYRIGIFIEGNVVEFNRILHRKEVYRYFP
ncbi:MAG: type II toxin-antitoxin system RelE/ParE family toxin [Bacteroidota bacterium]